MHIMHERTSQIFKLILWELLLELYSLPLLLPTVKKNTIDETTKTFDSSHSMLTHENCEGKEKKIHVTIYKHPFLGNIVKQTIPPLLQGFNTNNTPKSLQKYLTLPSCSETTPPLVLG